MQRRLDKCVDYSNVEGPYPFHISTMTGMFVKVEYKLTSHDLERLVYDLKTWVRNAPLKEKEQLKKCKKQFIVPLESLNECSPEVMHQLLKNFPSAHFTLKLQHIDEEKAKILNEKINLICRFEKKIECGSEI